MTAPPPEDPQAVHRRAMEAFAHGQADEAFRLMQRSLELAPDSSVFHSNFGVLCRLVGRMDDAVVAWRRAADLDARNADAHINLAAALRDRGDLQASLEHAEQAIAIAPQRPEAHFNLALSLASRRRFDEAIARLRALLRSLPRYEEARTALAWTLTQTGQLDEAEVLLRDVIAANPRDANAIHQLAQTLRQKGDVAASVEMCRAALRIDPKHAQASNNLGTALMELGSLEEAIEAYRAAVQHDPKFAAAHSNLLYAMHFDRRLDAATIFAAHQEFDRRHARPLLRSTTYANDRSPECRLRIGYVSPDFREHPVGRAMLPLMSCHDREAFEIFFYSDVSGGDHVTAELRRRAHTWLDTAALSDIELAERIRADRIDVLVDLSLHMAHNRMLVLARKPAPVQATFIGYPATSGLSSIDYRITDAYLDPPGETEAVNSEQLIRLPGSFWCYRGEDVAIDPPPSIANGYITFGVLNNPAKANAATIKLWAKVLDAVPNSKLLILAPRQSDRLVQLYAASGIAPPRLELLSRRPRVEYLKAHGRIDIALDTLPYNGHMTSCDALWMGVPVVSLLGQTSVGRGGHSLLANLDLMHLLARTPDQFVEIAAALARDPDQLRVLRSELRDRMRRSPLCDERGFTRDVEAAYRQMWWTWCSSPERPGG
jgi:predicted O-linked N-acetylglucosamine transferase (SPINDLY family)